MRRQDLFYLLLLFSAFILSGCVVRTYQLTRDRVDQDLSIGNRGYIQGRAPVGEEKEKKTTRTTQAVEIELYPPIKFERTPKAKKSAPEPIAEKKEDSQAWGNRGYIRESNIPETARSTPVANVEKYTVQKGDTLQKISKKFYGTTKKWNKIYEANKETLKGPNKIYPGQTIDIPIEPLKETRENLK